MPTARTRARRPHKPPFTARAIELFLEMEKIECTCPQRNSGKGIGSMKYVPDASAGGVFTPNSTANLQ